MIGIEGEEKISREELLSFCKTQGLELPHGEATIESGDHYLRRKLQRGISVYQPLYAVAKGVWKILSFKVSQQRYFWSEVLVPENTKFERCLIVALKHK